MRLKALPPVTDPGLAMVTDGTDHLQPGGVHSRVLYDTISGLEHALLLATLGANRQALNTLAEVTEGTGLLLPATLLAVHRKVARLFR